jgi:cytochrome c-type biogenesis protein CcmH
MVERMMRGLLAVCLLTLAYSLPVRAEEAAPASADPVLEARMMVIATELRCLVCQNQTIADSHAGLAEDLRREIRSMLAKGMSNQQILDFMTERYGDFVLYRPPLKTSTALLWVGPGLLMLAGLGSLVWVLRKRQRMAADAFEPDEPESQEDESPHEHGAR